MNKKAKESFKTAENDISDHFAGISKKVKLSSSAKREIEDIMPLFI